MEAPEAIDPREYGAAPREYGQGLDWPLVLSFRRMVEAADAETAATIAESGRERTGHRFDDANVRR